MSRTWYRSRCQSTFNGDYVIDIIIWHVCNPTYRRYTYMEPVALLTTTRTPSSPVSVPVLSKSHWVYKSIPSACNNAHVLRTERKIRLQVKENFPNCLYNQSDKAPRSSDPWNCLPHTHDEPQLPANQQPTTYIRSCRYSSSPPNLHVFSCLCRGAEMRHLLLSNWSERTIDMRIDTIT